MVDETALSIYTDGSSKPKPRRGGVGIRYVFIDASGHEVFEDLSIPGYKGATNNEMELKACILGLQNAAPYVTRGHFQRIDIYTDSNYVVTNVPNALFVWPKFKWLKKGGGPVLNAELWKDFVRWRVKLKVPVYANKVEAHSTDTHNQAVDRLAKESAEYSINKPVSPRIVRRKVSKAKTRIGSVGMQGQRVRLRIIQGEYLPVQKLYRYRYEVVSKSSEFYGSLDFVCSSELLRETHVYSVRLNDDSNNPRILKVYREIPKAPPPSP